MKNQELSMEEALRFASTPQGQAVLSQLQQAHSQALEAAMLQAQTGDYRQIKKTLSDFINSPSGQAVLEQLRRSSNG